MSENNTEELKKFIQDARKLANKLGLDPYKVKYWLVDHDEMAEYISYQGFPKRYPHWRWAMQYDKNKKSSRYLNSRVFEIVINDSPSHAYLQESNEIADQKGVICHVEGHSDFFKNNEMYKKLTEDFPAVERLSKNAERVKDIINNEEVSREEVEKFIDSLMCISDNIDQYSEKSKKNESNFDKDLDNKLIKDKLKEKGLSEEIIEQTFDIEKLLEESSLEEVKDLPEEDLLYFFMKKGSYYHEDKKEAIPLEQWQKEIINIIREESYYFAPQKMTQFMNEGWATFIESLMMSREKMASPDEILSYADHVSKVTSQDMNPYSLGLNLWRYIEDKKNREQIFERLLKVEGINKNNIYNKIDYGLILKKLEPKKELFNIPESLDELDDSYKSKSDINKYSEESLRKHPWKALTNKGVAERNFSLTEIKSSRKFITEIKPKEIENISKRIDNKNKYKDIDSSLQDFDYTYAWKEMRNIMKLYTDVTFIDTFLTEEFIEDKKLFTFEYDGNKKKVESTEIEDVKNKLLLDITNFGKPKIVVKEDNYKNKNYLLLKHKYDGIQIDLQKAQKVLEYIYENLWGRPVYLETVIKERNDRNEIKEKNLKLKYDGKEHTKIKEA